MRRIDMMTGLDMEQSSQGFVTNFMHPDITPVNTVPNLQAHSLQEPYDNNSMFFEHPEYHHHQRASNLGPGMSTTQNFYPPHPAFHAPSTSSHQFAHGSHYGAVVGGSSTEHDRNAHFMGHGYKRKSAEVVPGNYQYPAAAPPCSYPQMNTPEAAPSSFSQFGTYPQPLDQRSVRNRAGAAPMDPVLSHGHNNFIQGNYGAHPFPPPGPIWYDQHCNGNRPDGSSSLWSQSPPVPYMHGNPVPFAYAGHNYFSHHPPPPPPPPIIYSHMASGSYTVPETMHDASYSHVGPVQPTGFRINQQHPRDDFVPAPTLRHHGLPQFRAIPVDEFAFFGEREDGFYDAVHYVDHHQDMRLDIEDMSYEELLALSDQIGTVKTGLSEEDVKELLDRRTSLSTRINLEEAPSSNLETDSCSICQENYKIQDKIATLDCRHEYHAECLKKWLVIKNVCPICKSEALVMEKKKLR